jgi:hypothetical protein
MDIFNSQWLLNMLAKSSKTPQGRILSLFDILADWIQAPNMQLDIKNNSIPSQQLIAFCTAQAKACGAENPAMLAEHIVLIARNAAQQEINQPGCNSLAHAKKAANALILAQTQKEWFFSDITISKHAVYTIAASVFLLIGAVALWLPNLMPNNHPQTTIASSSAANVLLATAPTQASAGISAHDAAAMYAKFEQMRNGTCQFPEAIQIPDKDKTIYLENVVGGKLPTDLHDLAIANAYLEKVRCNFTPMLMAHSK